MGIESIHKLTMQLPACQDAVERERVLHGMRVVLLERMGTHPVGGYFPPRWIVIVEDTGLAIYLRHEDESQSERYAAATLIGVFIALISEGGFGPLRLAPDVTHERGYQMSEDEWASLERLQESLALN